MHVRKSKKVCIMSVYTVIKDIKIHKINNT